jgi:hypothetical protein
MDTIPSNPPEAGGASSPARWTREQQLLHYIAERDVPCPLCGYNLRALTVPRCPECGREITLVIRAVNLCPRAWVALTVSLLASAGLGLFLIPFLVAEGKVPGGNGPFTHALAVYFIAAIPLAGLVLLIRRRLIRLDRHVQWLLAAAAVCVSLAAFVLFCLTTT